MSHYGIVLALALVFDNVWLEICWFQLNVGFFGMEIKHKVCKNLVMIVGEISAVEIELFLSSILVSCGIFGNAGL